MIAHKRLKLWGKDKYIDVRRCTCQIDQTDPTSHLKTQLAIPEYNIYFVRSLEKKNQTSLHLYVFFSPPTTLSGHIAYLILKTVFGTLI